MSKVTIKKSTVTILPDGPEAKPYTLNFRQNVPTVEGGIETLHLASNGKEGSTELADAISRLKALDCPIEMRVIRPKECRTIPWKKYPTYHRSSRVIKSPKVGRGLTRRVR